MNHAPYLVPAHSVLFEEDIKKSRFLTYLAHTPTVDLAKGFIKEIKQTHPNANHHCWAFVAGRPNDSMQWGFSDDGEPSGTAGKPILAQLTGSNVGEMTAVVVRYFGGIHLGTGGLVKAYGGGVQQALLQLDTTEKILLASLQLCCEYNQSTLLETLLKEFQAETITAEYMQDIRLTVALDCRQLNQFKQTVVNRSGNRIQVLDDDENPFG